MSATKLSEYEQFEGELLRKAENNKYKRYWYCLLGKELYCYKKRDSPMCKAMHNLIGVFVKEEPEETLPNNVTPIFSFKLLFPPNKSR